MPIQKTMLPCNEPSVLITNTKNFQSKEILPHFRFFLQAFCHSDEQRNEDTIGLSDTQHLERICGETGAGSSEKERF